MYTVYVFRDEDGKLYKGMTNNLFRRVREHRAKKTLTTAKMHNPTLVYKEEFDFFEDARRRELYFKTAAGRRFLKKTLPAMPG